MRGAESGTLTASRSYTVGYVRDSGTFEPLPAVTLKGGWLREAGFDTGTAVNVRVLPDCLILTAQELPSPPPPEPEIMQILRRVCKFSARKQKQVTELIEVIGNPQR
ncbi:endoribonuclease SymE [Erwinia amylovora]|uniref:endoribonuclease SymE n=1 Tax=Erwinia amylovora TaxID=552 RepID=UPI00237B88AC|nr:endoribonuclease SymE [Erwinia amylovora]